MTTSTTPTAIPTARRRFLAGACALACLAAAPQAGAWGWGSEKVEGRGPVKRQERSVGRFDGLSVAVPGTVEVRTGNAEGVVIETEDNLLALIETVVEDGTLKIRARANTNIRTRNLRIVVRVRELDRVTLAGSANVDVDAMRGQRVRFDIGGSGEIKVRRVEGGDINVNLGGSGELEVEGGSARKLSLSVAGSGKVDLGKVRAETAGVTVAGSGDARLWVRDALSMTIAGSGDVEYYGDPQVSKSVVGSGSLRRLGSAPN